MYDINLIRDKVVPERQKHVMFSVVSVAALGFVLTILAVIFFSAANSRTIDIYTCEIDKLEDQLSALYPGTPTQDELASIVRRIKPDLDEIGRLIDQQAAMTYMWEGIAAAVPDSVWLTRIDLTSPKRAAGGSKARGKAQAGGLVLEGMAISVDGGGSSLIRRFAERLQQTDELSAYLAGARYVETGKRQVGDVKIMGFEITCPFR